MTTTDLPPRVPGQRIRVLIADDHAVFRQGLRRLVESERDFLVVGEANDGAEAVKLVKQLRPDIVLLDVSMPGTTGFDALEELQQIDVPIRAVLLTAEIERDKVVRALRLGARGVLLKSSGSDLIFRGLRAVMAGEHWVDRQTVSDVVNLLRETAAPAPHTNSFGLTPRQLEIVAAVVKGKTNREIATSLSISEDTVKHHLSQIFMKTGAANRVELALLAVERRLLPRT